MSTPPARSARKAPRRAMAPVTAPQPVATAPVIVAVPPVETVPTIEPISTSRTLPATDAEPESHRVPAGRPDQPTAARPDAEEPSEDSAEPVAPTRRGLSAAALALVLVAVLALGGAGVAFVKAHQLRSTDAARNLALVDTSVTNEAVGQVSVALNRIFSYDYTNPKPTQDAAAALLTGDAAGQYKTIFDALQSKASGQQLTLKAKSVIGGVSSLTDDSARLLIFLDQSSTRATDSSTSTAAAQLSVEAVKQGGIWKISQIRPL